MCSLFSACRLIREADEEQDFGLYGHRRLELVSYGPPVVLGDDLIDESPLPTQFGRGFEQQRHRAPFTAEEALWLASGGSNPKLLIGPAVAGQVANVVMASNYARRGLLGCAVNRERLETSIDGTAHGLLVRRPVG